MKTAYELAMERLNKQAPPVKLTERQKGQLAELDKKYAAKIAEKEIFLKGELATAISTGDLGHMEEIRKQLALDRKALEQEREDKKDEVRKARPS